MLFSFPDTEFKQIVRVEKRTFQYLLNLIKYNPIFVNESRNTQKSVWVQLLIALDRLGTNGNGSTIGRIARGGGIGNGTVTLYTNRVIKALLSIKDTFIRWPSAEERNNISDNFSAKYNLPGCVGVVDGTNAIIAQRPKIDGPTYWNRKGFYGINCQIVCDDQKRILFYQVGWPGSVGDSRAFRNSDIGMVPENYFSAIEYLLGDSAYTLSKHMLTPYIAPSCYVDINRRFNEQFSTARVIIEHVMGLLKNRWGCLRGLRTQVKRVEDFAKLNEWIVACFVMHNIVIERNDKWEDPAIIQAGFDAWVPDARNHDIVGETARNFRERMKGVLLNLQ
jgi:hypothetical protein